MAGGGEDVFRGIGEGTGGGDIADQLLPEVTDSLE